MQSVFHIIELGSRVFWDHEGDSLRRTLLKNGVCNVKQHQSRRRKLIDFRYTTLVNSSWTYTLSIFLVVLSIAWFFFAVLYWLICFTHGDFQENHLPELQTENNFKPCIYQVRSFASCFLFSMETQHTVGYGIKAPTQECPEAIFVNTIHCILGFIMQGFMAAIVFSKMTLPRQLSQTIQFSNNALICSRNGKLCLMFRVGDIRKRHIINAKVRSFFVRATKTLEDEKLLHTQQEMKMESDGCQNSVFFNWPIIMFHNVDENSPLYYLSPSDLIQKKFEIIVILEGTDENTNQVIQARTSYVPNEIIWGHSFEKMVNYDELREEYEVDFSKFDNILPISTPLCSAAYINDYIKMQQKGHTNGSPHIKLDFTPRQSIGEIPPATLQRLRERFYRKNNIVEETDDLM